MAVIRELLVRIGVKSDDKQMKRADAGFKNLASSAKAFGAVLATGLAAKGFSTLITLASDANEEMTKFGAIFGDAAQATEKRLEGISKNTNIATDSLRAMTSQFGATLKPTLGSAEAASEMSARLTELALDIASFNNLEPEVALQKLRSGMLGSVEPMDAVGVNLRAANIGLEEFAKANGKTVKDVTAAEKAQLRFAAIVEQMTMQGSMGDATTTAGGYANQMRALKSQVAAVGAEIGKALLPMVQDFVAQSLVAAKATMAWLKSNRDLIDRGLNVLKGVLRGVWTVLQTVIKAVDWFRRVIFRGNNALFAMAVAAGALTLALGWPLALMIAIGAAIAAVIDDFQTWQRGGESAIGAIVAWFQWAKEEILDSIEGIITGFFKWAGASDETIGRVRDLFRSVVELGGAALKVVKELFSFNIAGALSAISGARNAVGSGRAAAAGLARTAVSNVVNAGVNASVVVNPAPGQNEQQIGNSVAGQLQKMRDNELRAANSRLAATGG